jgi:hypothetical protein
MGRIAEALRENLRQLAQADARILRELDGALPSISQPEPQVAGELAEGLEKLGVKELKALCKGTHSGVATAGRELRLC